MAKTQPLWLTIYKIINAGVMVLLASTFGYVSHCKHTPTCSEYMAEQIALHGTITGLRKGFVRLMNCR